MVATLLRLKFSLTKNSLKRQVWTLVSLIIGGISALGLIPLVGAGAFALSYVPTDVAALVIVLVGSITILAWSLLPILIFGSDETLDPARFATLNVPSRQLTTGLLLSGFIGVPGLITGILVFFPALTWIRHPVAAVAAVLMAPICVLSCFAYSRLLTTVGANALRSRRGRDLIAVIAFIALIALTQLVPFLADSTRSTEIVEKLYSVASVLAWTPLGAPWAVPVDLIDGNYLAALARGLIAIAALVLALMLWSRSLQKAMISSAEAHSSSNRDGNSVARMASRPWAKLGSTATWAIVARCLRYWRSDPRYILSAAVVVILPLVFLIISRTTGGAVADTGSADEVFSVTVTMNVLLVAVGPFLSMIMGWGLHNDIGSDSTAFWTHVSTGVSGRADRAGRIFAMSLWFVPAGAIVTVGTAMLGGQVQHLPALLGASAGLYLAGCAVSSMASAMLTYPVARPGESPFKSQSGGAWGTMAAQMVSSLVVLTISLPVLALLLCDFLVGPLFGWLALPVGVVGGLGLVALGIRWGATIYEKRSVRLLAQLVKADN